MAQPDERTRPVSGLRRAVVAALTAGALLVGTPLSAAFAAPTPTPPSDEDVRAAQHAVQSASDDVAAMEVRLAQLAAVADDAQVAVQRAGEAYSQALSDAQVASLLKMMLRGALAERLVPVTHYNGVPISAENVVRPILSWEKSPSGPGWPTGDVERDNPPSSHVEQPSPE